MTDTVTETPAAEPKVTPRLKTRYREEIIPALRSEFENARTITVNLQGISSAVTNGSATVTCRRDYVVTTVDGRTLRSSARMVVTMNRHNGSWVIDNIRYEAER